MGYLGDNSTHYFIPGIGIYNLDIEKAKPVKILYDFLDEIGEIDRLKNLDHLGDVREVIDGTRHSRFDYIALIFALIDTWVQKVEEIHASSRVNVEPEPEQGEEVKGKDLVKCWALLFNIGHLEWTFFTERILLEVLFEEKLHTKLIENIDREEIKKRAKEILEFRDYSHFYQILAYLRFDCLYKKNKDKINKEDKIWFEEVYKQMFEKYIVDDFSDKAKGNNLPYLKNLYRTVRNIAFLLLDSFYTPSGLNLSPVLLFDNPELIRSIFFDETEISNTLKFLNRQLYKSVYLNEKVLAIQSLYYDSLKEKLKTRIEGLKNGKDICDFVKEIYDKLKKDIENIKKEVKNKSKHVPIMRFEFEGDDLNEQLKEKEKLDKPSLRAKLDGSSLVEVVNSNCYRVVWKTPLNFYVIQYNSKSDRRSLITAFRESFDTVRKFLEEIKDKYTFNETKKFLEDLEDLRNNCSEAYRDRIERLVEHIKNKYGEASYIEHKRDVIERIAKKYIEQALKLFFNNEDIRWEWVHTSFLRSYFNFPDAVIGFVDVDDVIEFYEENITSKFEKKEEEQKEEKKEHEISKSYSQNITRVIRELYAKLEIIKKLKEGEDLIKGKPDILCIAISNLIAYSRTQEEYIKDDKDDIENCKQKNQSRPQLMEIDGLILGLTTEKQLFICLIEAGGKKYNAVNDMTSKIKCRKNDVLRGYDISDLTSLVKGLKLKDNKKNKGLKDNKKNLSIAYLIITDEKIPTI